MIFVGGPETNQWVHRRGRMYLRARDYFADFEKVYGAAGVLPALDGADHFRLRKSLSAAYSRKRLAEQLDELYDRAGKHMAHWRVGDSYPATGMSRRMINAQISPLIVGVETQDIIDDLLKYKERALSVHIVKVLPKVMLKNPGIRRRAKTIATLLERIQSVHTPAQRAGAYQNLTDDYLSLHASDPQFVPESNLRFAFTAALVASAYLGDASSFTLYAMATQPEVYAKIQAGSRRPFRQRRPGWRRHQPLLNRRHAPIPDGMPTYVPHCPDVHAARDEFVCGQGLRVAGGIKGRNCPDRLALHERRLARPLQVRYRPLSTFARNEHRGPGYTPYGLGTHNCLGSRWMDLQLAVNVLMVAHYFTLNVSPENFKLRFNPLPSMKPSKKLKFLIAERKRELPA